MDTIKYHGSGETEIITSRAILIRMRNQVHVDVMISISCLYHTLYIRLRSLIYVPREPGALPSYCCVCVSNHYHNNYLLGTHRIKVSVVSMCHIFGTL